MDQQEKPPAQRRTRARRNPGPPKEQANQPSTTLAHDMSDLSVVAPATKHQVPPSAPPEQPKTDGAADWNSYRNAWQAYCDSWRSYWEAQDQRGRTKRAEGEEEYRAAWHAHWEHLKQPWRTEPEIDEERQTFLAEQRASTPDIKKGLYPFKDIEPKLIRADVEWLLATHEDGRGPVDWNDKTQRHRIGLDLRGARLSGMNLTNLPLARLHGGLTPEEREDSTRPQRHLAAVHLERALLSSTHLEGAYLTRGHLEEVEAINIHLEQADLYAAHLEGANFQQAHLEGAELRRSFFDPANGLDDLALGNNEYGGASLANIQWNGVNLTEVRWSYSVPAFGGKRQFKTFILGDERRARQNKSLNGLSKTFARRLHEYRAGVRANRQLAVVLRSQGMNEEADHFAYRAQLLQRVVLRRQKQFLKYGGSWILWLIACYGYRSLRSFLFYLLLIFGFATAYFFVGPTAGVPFSPLGALVFSVTSFHGRGFFPGGSPGYLITLDDPLTVIALLRQWWVCSSKSPLLLRLHSGISGSEGSSFSECEESRMWR